MLLYGIGAIALIALVVWWCKHHHVEGLTRRLPVANELLALTYSTGMAESPYFQKWNFDVQTPPPAPALASPQIEGYTDLYTCEKACEHVLGATPHQQCLTYCENATMIQNQLPNPSSCDNAACGDNQVCARPGFYNTAPKACLNSLTPGVQVPASLNPALRPLYPPMKPLVPAWAPLTPAWAPINPIVTPINPTWTPINPVASGVLAPLIPTPAQFNIAMANIKRKEVAQNTKSGPFQQRACPVGQFHNHGTGMCENRFQI